MLTYRYVSRAFVLISCFLIIGYFVADISLLYLLSAFALFVFLCFWGSAFICSGFYTNAICRDVNNNGKNVFITFDDSPEESETIRVLEVLKKHDVRATFFVIGEKAEKNIELIREIAKQGHVLGNHSYSHKNFFPLKNSKKIAEEIKITYSIIKSVKPSEVDIFRPPFGVTNPSIAKAIKRLDVCTIGWSLKSLDTTINNHERILKRLVKKTRPGDVVLMHDSIKNINKVLDDYITFLKKNNYNFETVDKLVTE